MAMVCPMCQEVIDPAAYTSSIYYCPNCSQELSEDDVRRRETQHQRKIERKQKALLSAAEARERWRAAVASQLGEPDWPLQTEEERQRWSAYAQRGTAANYSPWPEVDDVNTG